MIKIARWRIAKGISMNRLRMNIVSFAILKKPFRNYSAEHDLIYFTTATAIRVRKIDPCDLMLYRIESHLYECTSLYKYPLK